MDWLDKLRNFPELVQEEPRYGYLVVAGPPVHMARRGYLRLEMDLFPSRKSRRQFPDEFAGTKNFPFLVGRDSHGCNRAGSVSVFCRREIKRCMADGQIC